MSLCRLVYLSEAVKPMTPAELSALVNKSRVNNDTLGISGLLLHSSGNFMQVLEGDEMHVSSLFAHISRDSRHQYVKELLRGNAERRLFGKWGMCLGDTSRVQPIDRERVDRTIVHLRRLPGRAAGAESAAIRLLQEFHFQLMKDAA